MSSPVTEICRLNDRWRVITAPLQYILQYRENTVPGSAKSPRHSGWKGLRFCRTRTALLRDIKESCGQVDRAALEIIERLPAWHDDTVKKEEPAPGCSISARAICCSIPIHRNRYEISTGSDLFTQ
ncbi:MAG: hypothetical protein O3C49_05720 [Proteobacteria bacterium]|nr:hypothetical protein [Pseudomonadota bacterium]